MRITLLLGILLTTFNIGLAQKNTLENLQQAYQDEANAAHRFDLYADQASRDGYIDLANLFCAVSNGEYMQMKNLKNEIQSLGGKVWPLQYNAVDVGSSSQNLMEAIKNEATEKRLKYQQYYIEAKKEGLNIYAESFKKAKEIERHHEYLFKKALYSLGDNEPADYFVSNVTGEVQERKKCMAKAKCDPAPKPKLENEKYLKF